MGKFVLKEKMERREGVHLHIKGERCSSPKCALTRRNYPPGAHGPGKRRRITPYGEQLREKQRVKRLYGLLERQFRIYFEKATKEKGDTEVFFIRALESRLDNVIFRMGFAVSRRQARQMVGHGHFLVNGKPNNIPSYQVKVGDAIKLKESRRDFILYASFRERAASMTLPPWLAIVPESFEGKIVAAPETEEITKQFDIKKIIEFYSR